MKAENKKKCKESVGGRIETLFMNLHIRCFNFSDADNTTSYQETCTLPNKIININTDEYGTPRERIVYRNYTIYCSVSLTNKHVDASE